jgi:hypothetical protein
METMSNPVTTFKKRKKKKALRRTVARPVFAYSAYQQKKKNAAIEFQ